MCALKYSAHWGVHSNTVHIEPGLFLSRGVKLARLTSFHLLLTLFNFNFNVFTVLLVLVHIVKLAISCLLLTVYCFTLLSLFCQAGSPRLARSPARGRARSCARSPLCRSQAPPPPPPLLLVSSHISDHLAEVDVGVVQRFLLHDPLLLLSCHHTSAEAVQSVPAKVFGFNINRLEILCAPAFLCCFIFE